MRRRKKKRVVISAWNIQIISSKHQHTTHEKVDFIIIDDIFPERRTEQHRHPCRVWACYCWRWCEPREVKRADRIYLRTMSHKSSDVLHEIIRLERFSEKKTPSYIFFISKPKRAHNFWSIYFSNKVFSTVKKSAQVEIFLFHLSLGNLDFAFPLHPKKTNAAMSRVRFVVFSSLSFTSMNKKRRKKLLLDKTFQHFPRVLFAFKGMTFHFQLSRCKL